MNYGLILRLLAFILLAVTAAFVVTIGVAWWVEASTESTRAFGISALVSFLLMAAALAFSRGGAKRILHKEALALIGLGWLLASLLGMIPYLFLLPEKYGWSDAFFESVSGFTTTGASVLNHLETLPESLLFWRALTQWIGGLGVVVFFVGLLSSLGAGAKILFSRESTGSSDDVFDGRVQTAALRITGLYLLISAACCLTFRWVGLGWFDAVCHMFTTVSTGGFSTRSDSYAAFANPAFEWTGMAFMILGGISFFFLLRLVRRDTEHLRRNSEVPVFILLLAGFFLIILLKEFVHGPPADGALLVRQVAFQVVSLATTSGFTTADYDAWANPSKILLLTAMLIGGCAGSTSGGFKVIRFYAVIKILANHLEKIFRPNVVREIRINDKPIPAREREDLFTYLGLSVVALLGALILLSFFEPSLDLMSSISAIIACLGNIGPGFELVGPTENFSFLAAPSKVLLSLLMIMGRLEFYAILVLFMPSIWRKFS